jgi:serine/threonine protein kinase
VDETEMLIHPSIQLASSYQSLLSEFSSPELTHVGNYSVGKLIGKGSFGKVYLASHNLTNGSKVVLKSANKDDANLAREIHHHRQFLHPHIARLYEVIVTETLVWLVLEYCPGDELYNHLLNNGRMEPAKVQKIFTQLVGAVSYVHAKSCVHRDLKLENILLDKHGNVKLVDFGFTREYKGTTSYLQTWCGTICYSAPEMIKGEKYAGEKVDVWSLGIILYALLCGELPFDDDDDSTTKTAILKNDPTYPDHLPQPAVDLIKKLLSKRPLLRPNLGDILKDPWLAEHAPQQQEVLKLQQPPPFTTDLEKDVLERMRSAGVDIDMVIEHVLSQRCDSLAGWWALLLEKEQRKERRRERKRREREADAKSLRRLSAASSRLLALGEIYEVEEGMVPRSPRTRGRPLSRNYGVVSQAPDLPKVSEQRSPPANTSGVGAVTDRTESHSGSRPPLPPKDYAPNSAPSSRPATTEDVKKTEPPATSSTTPDPNLLSPEYVPPPQRKRPKPLKEHLAWVKGLFEKGAIRRAKQANDREKKLAKTSPFASGKNGNTGVPQGNIRELRRMSSAGPLGTQSRRTSLSSRQGDPQTHSRIAPQRPRINTNTSSSNSIPTTARLVKRTSLSPATSITLHNGSGYPLHRRRSSVGATTSGLRGRKSTSSSVSSIRTTYQSTTTSTNGQGTTTTTIITKGHKHSHSKASSTSSASLVSPSTTTGGASSHHRTGRSPHGNASSSNSVVKVLVAPGTPTATTFPSGIRFARRAPGSSPSIGGGGGSGNRPKDLGLILPNLAAINSLHVNQLADSNGNLTSKSPHLFGNSPQQQYYSNNPPTSPGLPVFARRKRSLFKGPLSGGGGGGGNFSSSGNGFNGFGITTTSSSGGSAWNGTSSAGSSPGGYSRSNGTASNGNNNNSSSKNDRNASLQGRASSDLGMLGVMEEEEDEEEEDSSLYPAQSQPHSATTPGEERTLFAILDDDDDALYEDVEIDQFGRSVVIHADGHEEVIEEEEDIMEEEVSQEMREDGEGGNVPVFVTAPPSLSSGRDHSTSSTTREAALAATAALNNADLDSTPKASTTLGEEEKSLSPAEAAAKMAVTNAAASATTPTPSRPSTADTLGKTGAGATGTGLSTIIAAAAAATAAAGSGSRPGTANTATAAATTNAKEAGKEKVAGGVEVEDFAKDEWRSEVEFIGRI